MRAKVTRRVFLRNAATVGVAAAFPSIVPARCFSSSRPRKATRRRSWRSRARAHRRGLSSSYDRRNLVGATTDGRDFFIHYPDGFVRREPNTLGPRVRFRAVNDQNILSLYASGGDGKEVRLMDGIDVSAMYPGGGRCKDFLSLQIGLVAAGEGSAAFRSFRYGETLKDRSTSQKENGK